MRQAQIMHQDLPNFIELNNRLLWIDGDNTVSPDLIADLLLDGKDINSGIYVNEIDEEVKRFNRISQTQLKIKEKVRPLSFNWNIPTEYKKLDVEKYVLEKLEQELILNNFSNLDSKIRLNRVDQELRMFKEHDKLDIVKTLVYIVDTFREKNVVWGIGRGSSCSSYILYLIGVHDVDSVEYDLDIHEFLR